MNKKLKIKISNDAFDFIIKLLEFHDEYDCIALKEPENGGCCKNSKVDIILDNTINCNVIEDLSSNFNEIIIVLKKDSLYLKATPSFTNKSKGCGGCGGCGSKSKDCTSCSGCSMKSK